MSSVQDGRCCVNRYVRHGRMSFEGYETGSPGKRGVVDGLSKRSGKRLRHVLENLPRASGAKSLVGLTYAAEYPDDGRIVKGHLDGFLRECRRECGPAFWYVWVLEFQRRGAPHFHLLMPVVLVPAWLSWTWYRVVGSGDELHLAAGTSRKRAPADMSLGAYMLKRYIAKSWQKIVPDDFHHPGRMWGCTAGLGDPLWQVEVELAVGLKVNRQLRRAVESRSDRRLPRHVREGRYRGITDFRGGRSIEKLLEWAKTEVDAGR